MRSLSHLSLQRMPGAMRDLSHISLQRMPSHEESPPPFPAEDAMWSLPHISLHRLPKAMSPTFPCRGCLFVLLQLPHLHRALQSLMTTLRTSHSSAHLAPTHPGQHLQCQLPLPATAQHPIYVGSHLPVNWTWSHHLVGWAMMCGSLKVRSACNPTKMHPSTHSSSSNSTYTSSGRRQVPALTTLTLVLTVLPPSPPLSPPAQPLRETPQ